jgi:hypothetical protein
MHEGVIAIRCGLDFCNKYVNGAIKSLKLYMDKLRATFKDLYKVVTFTRCSKNGHSFTASNLFVATDSFPRETVKSV